MTNQPSGVVLGPAKQVAPTSTRIDLVDSALVRAGRIAWKRIRDAAPSTFEDWHAIGPAIRVGRRLCMKATHSKKPQGRRYSDAMSVWLRENGLDDVGEPTRCEAVKLVEDLAISEWRDTLPEHERVRLNHPRSVLHAYDLARRAKRQSPSRRSVADMLELAAEALRRHMPFSSRDARLQAAANVLEGGRRENFRSAQSPDRRPCAQSDRRGARKRLTAPNGGAGRRQIRFRIAPLPHEAAVAIRGCAS